MEESWELIRSHYDVMEGRFHVLVRLIELAGPIVLGGRLLPAAAGPPAEAEPEPAPPAEPGA
jgi:hypothetical protein